MNKFDARKFKMTTVMIFGGEYEAIEFDGRTFVKPGFSGQAVGWVRERYVDYEKGLLHILLVTPDYWDWWYTLKFSEANRFGIGYPDIGASLYFCIYQKQWHKPENLPYTIEEGFYCDEYLSKYSLPYFMKKEECLTP